MVYTFGIFYSLRLEVGRKLEFQPIYFYGACVCWFPVNYFFAFRKEQLYKYFKTRLKVLTLIAIIIFGYVVWE